MTETASLEEFRKFQRDTVFYASRTDSELDMLEERVIALEEIIAARWPRSWLLRRRYARQLRASVAGYGWVGPGFRIQRMEAAGDLVGLSAEEREAIRPLTQEEIADRLREAGPGGQPG